MDCRFADIPDIKSLKSLWRDCFGDDDIYINSFFKFMFAPDRTIITTQNGEIVSALYIIDGSLMVYEKSFSFYYIYAVATRDSERGKGAMRVMFDRLFRYAEESDVQLMSIVPSDNRLLQTYYRYGFDIISEIRDSSLEEALKVVQWGERHLKFRADLNSIYKDYDPCRTVRTLWYCDKKSIKIDRFPTIYGALD